MGDIVDLHGRSIPIEDDELVENLARFADGTLSEVAVKARHHLSNEEWAALGESTDWSSWSRPASSAGYAPAPPKGNARRLRSSMRSFNPRDRRPVHWVGRHG